MWTISISENDQAWGIESIQEEILAYPSGSHYYTTKRFYYDFQEKIIAAAQISSIPQQENKIETKLWTTIVLNSPFQTWLNMRKILFNIQYINYIISIKFKVEKIDEGLDN